MKQEQWLAYLKENLSPRRYRHTLGCVKLANELAQIYSADSEKINTAALLHDVAKELSVEEMQRELKKANMQAPISVENNPALLHAYASAAMAQSRFDIEDQEILDAILYHTTGRENMTLSEKIIFIADATEEGRTYHPQIKLWREEAKENLDSAVLKVLEYNVIKIVKRGFILDENTVKARNDLVLRRAR